MRIAFPIWEFRPTGGIERSVTEAVKWLLQRGHQVDVITARDNSPLHHERLRVVRLPIPRFSSAGRPLRSMLEVPPFVAAASLYLRHQRPLYDLVINYGVGQSLYQDVLVATSCHAAWMQTRRHLPSRGIGNPLNGFILRVERYNYRRGGHGAIVAVSRQVVTQLQHFYRIDPDEVTVVYPGVDIHEFSPTGREEARAQVMGHLALPPDAAVLVFAGQEYRRKGLDVVIRALAGLHNPKAHLVVVGHDPIAEPYMRALAGELGVAGRVHLAGARDDMPRYFRSADVFVFPSRMDAFGMVALEAMACAVPVIVSSDAGVSELIRQWENGVVLDMYGDPAEVASAVNRLLGDSGLRARLGESARKTALQHTWDHHSEAILAVGERVVRNSATLSGGVLR